MNPQKVSLHFNFLPKWHNFAKFGHTAHACMIIGITKDRDGVKVFCRSVIKALDKFERIYFVFGKILNLLRQMFNVTVQFFIIVNGQILRAKYGHAVTLLRRQ